MMVGQDAHAVADADLFGEAAEGTKERVLARRARETREEVMFDEPEVVEPHLVGEFALRQRFFVERVPVDLRAREGALAFVEETKLHHPAPGRRCRLVGRVTPPRRSPVLRPTLRGTSRLPTLAHLAAGVHRQGVRCLAGSAAGTPGVWGHGAQSSAWVAARARAGRRGQQTPSRRTGDARSNAL